jgi:hypothetical protein
MFGYPINRELAGQHIIDEKEICKQVSRSQRYWSRSITPKLTPILLHYILKCYPNVSWSGAARWNTAVRNKKIGPRVHR